MAWLDNLKSWVAEKANPVQREIRDDEGTDIDTTQNFSYALSFNVLESVNRGTSMIVSDASSLDYDIKSKIVDGVVTGVRANALKTLLNHRPNPYQTIQDFRNNIFTDFILEGNIFIYWDGAFLYHLPAAHVTILTDEKTYVAGYSYNGSPKFSANEVIHIKDLSSTSIYRGDSRLSSARRNIEILQKMQKFQEQFFENGAIPGIVLETDNTLSQPAKDKTIQKWIKDYNPKNGAKKPLILDSGLKVSKLFDSNFKDLDFDIGIETHDTKILKALGVPPILLDGGNNANINPNLRLYYLETVLPILQKYTAAIERFFGYDVEVITNNVSALQPELKDLASYLSSLVNGGIIVPNEAREELRYPRLTDPAMDQIRVPANIAGSAVNPAVGGAPKKD